MRKSIDGLAALVRQRFKLDPYSKSLFLFCGRRCDRLKALYWENIGVVLLYMRLEYGSFRWPRKEAEAKLITAQQLRQLTEGLSTERHEARMSVI
jgi:transposase